MGLFFSIINPNYKPYIDPRDPAYEAPEGYCPTCEDFTTRFNRHGECSECGTEVRKGVEDNA